jgi:hypothetical protein
MPGKGKRMSDTDGWLERYRRNHENLARPAIFWVAVLMVVVGATGLLWSLPVPEEFRAISPLLNWGSTFLMVAVVYYFILSVSLAFGLIPFVLGVAALQLWIVDAGYDLTRAAAGLFAGGIIGLWAGHRSDSGFAAIVEDLQTIMIGPAWLLSVIYRRLGIPY